MSLIDCPSCDRHVSDRAFHCPHCNFQFPPAWIAPQRGTPLIDDDPKIAAAEETRTRYRGMMFIGLVAIMLGTAATLETRPVESEANRFGPVLLISGIVVLVGTGIAAAWRPRSR